MAVRVSVLKSSSPWMEQGKLLEGKNVHYCLCTEEFFPMDEDGLVVRRAEYPESVSVLKSSSPCVELG